MEFGVWKYMFNNVRFRLSGRHLLNIFPNKPISTHLCQLDSINVLRNRIAHHEPICFGSQNRIDLQNVINCYEKMIRLLQWMGIDAKELWYGLDHVDKVCEKITKI